MSGHSVQTRERNKWWAVAIAILALALVLRFFQISVRPLHHDEGVNHHFIEELFSKGYYPYSHENYHGPLLFYLLGAVVWLFGDSEAAMRSLPAVAGTALVLLPFAYRRLLGDRVAMFSALLLATSPSLVFYSRYVIHEMLFVFFQITFGLSLLTWRLRREEGSRSSWYAIWLSLAALIALKETFVIPVFWIGCALLSITWPSDLLRRLRDSRVSIGRGYLVALPVLFVIFSGGFRWFEGLREMVQAVPQWFGRGTSSDYGHFKPALYYIQMVVGPNEPVTLVVLVAVVLGILGALLLQHGRLVRPFLQPHLVYLFVWSMGTLLTYSFIPYKTPWLIISFTAPALVFAGAVFGALSTAASAAVQKFGWLLFAVSCLWDLRATIHYDYRSPRWLESLMFFESKPYGEPTPDNANPYTYVHTTDGMLELVEDIRRYLVHTPNAKILIGVDGYWPLPYYLRHVTTRAAYLHLERPEDYAGEYDIIVAEHTTTWESPDFERKYYRLTGASETHTYFRRKAAAEQQ